MEIDQLVSALVKASGKFTPFDLDGYNPHFRSRFGTLKAMKFATDTALREHGLRVLQFPSAIEGQPALTTILAHESGQMMQSTALLSLTKQDPQAQGSALSYLRRYSYAAVLGLVAEVEDDGNAASEPEKVYNSGAVQPIGKVDNFEGRAALREACKGAGMNADNVAGLFKKEFGHDPKGASNEDLLAFAALVKAGTYS